MSSIKVFQEAVRVIRHNTSNDVMFIGYASSTKAIKDQPRISILSPEEPPEISTYHLQTLT